MKINENWKKLQHQQVSDFFFVLELELEIAAEFLLHKTRPSQLYNLDLD